MSVLMATGVAIIASFMYNFPIMQKVELKSLENALHKNLYCQQAAIDALMGHIRGYVERKHEGVVVLFLAGSEGSGKTLTVDTFREVNPKWKKIVATHEQGDLNKMTQDQLVTALRGNIHASTLNFLFIDDIPDLAEDTPFVEGKLKPILRALKFEKTLVFLVITSYEGNTSLPTFLTNEYEHQTILYEAMPRSCVEKCAIDVIKALDANPRYIDMEALMDRIHFDDVDGVQVSRDGCKTVPITVALFLSESIIQQEREHEIQHPEQGPNEL
ncbi:uncharacterized protein LOC114828224 [Galendromus occidentalis]|uniref:Uncharacterized protein LOC114828224 n=1 Tax=Galendromus occidentalis TaxID=34638 RepID=A0AAJ7SEP0_9ACAR|nr:uncharacterized protein LOC114828224 [Galendromus occidentalis]